MHEFRREPVIFLSFPEKCSYGFILHTAFLQKYTSTYYYFTRLWNLEAKFVLLN